MSALVPLFLDVTLSLSNLTFTKVRRYTLVDGLHQIPELTIEVLCDDPALDLAALIGETAVALLDEPHLPRFDGLVRAVEQTSADPTGVSCYVLTLAPALWLTNERSGHHIFRHRSVLEIASDVAARYDHRIAAPELRLSRGAQDWPKHDYRVQYGETDRDFLLRILSEEGLVSHWTPSSDDPEKLVWTLTDDTSLGSPAFEVPFRPPSGALAANGPHVQAVTTRARLTSSEARLRDYDHEHPAVRLEGRCWAGDGVGTEQPLVRYSHAVGDFRDEAGGLALAQMRLQAARARSRVYRWETSFSAPAGSIVRLHDHPREDANGDFLIVAMRTEVEPTRRTHVAELVPAASPWRSEPRPKPRIHGTQTAVVVGAPGQEIDVDDQGRVEVEFRWDTRDLHRTGASRRVRIAMPWMGTSRGFWTLPRVGDEVVIAYLDGDPDEPLVVGSVNNAAAPPAASLPASQTQSWWKSKTTPNGDGYNAILMEDLKANELLALYAERDSFWNTQRRAEIHVGEDQIVRVRGSQSVSVGGGPTAGAGSMAVTVQDNYVLNVGKGSIESTGDFGIHVSNGNLSLYASADRHDGVGGNYFLNAGSVWTTATSTLQYNAEHVHFFTPDFHVSCSGTILLSTGGSSIEIGPGGIKITSHADVAINGAFVKVNC